MRQLLRTKWRRATSLKPSGRQDDDAAARQALPRATRIVPARFTAVLVSLAIAVTAGPATALAGSGDTAATKAYIQANYRLVQAAASRTHRIEAALHGVLTDVRRECPMAAAGSPQDADSEQLSNEVIGALVTAAIAVDRAAGRQFASAAWHLTWSNPALTRTVHAYVGKVTTLIALAPPNLCTDVKSWAASGFLELPVSTISFAPRFMSAWVAPGELPDTLAPYETPGDRQLARRTNRLEEDFSELEAREVETWGQIMNTLALWP